MGNIIAPLILIGIVGAAGFFFYKYYIQSPTPPAGNPPDGSPTLNPDVPYNGDSSCGSSLRDLMNPACRPTPPANPLAIFDQFKDNPIVSSTIAGLQQAAHRNLNTHSNVAQIDGNIFLQ